MLSASILVRIACFEKTRTHTSADVCVWVCVYMCVININVDTFVPVSRFTC